MTAMKLVHGSNPCDDRVAHMTIGWRLRKLEKDAGRAGSLEAIHGLL